MTSEGEVIVSAEMKTCLIEGKDWLKAEVRLHAMLAMSTGHYFGVTDSCSGEVADFEEENFSAL